MGDSLIYGDWINQHLLSFNKIDHLPQPTIIKIDSRHLQKGDWFCPIIGENFDGHNFIQDAFKKTGNGFFYQSNRKELVPKNLLKYGVEVDCCLSTLQAIAKHWRLHHKDLTVFAITGSVGKTTVKEMLWAILKETVDHSTINCSIKNFNNEVGVPLSLLSLKAEHKYCILEFGARHQGDIRFLCELASPHIVALLNAGTAHLGEFGSKEILRNTKLEIFRYSPPNAHLIAFSDDPKILQGAEECEKRVTSFGFESHADVRVCDEKWLSDGKMDLNMNFFGRQQKLTIGSSHVSYPINIAAACSLALAAGIPLVQLAKSLENFTGVNGRYKIYRNSNYIYIDDTYNASPESMSAGLNSLQKSFPSNSKMLVLGDMLELGPKSLQKHFEIGAHCNKLNEIKYLLGIGPQMKETLKGAISTGLPKESCLWFENVESALNDFKSLIKDIEILYMKASNSMRFYKFTEYLKTEGSI
ncbi:MAG: UDP-N-acetylmuramoyl-tripeptide--D-alanyl-D-alanine ligase [Bdellovibrionota bacterium]